MVGKITKDVNVNKTATQNKPRTLIPTLPCQPHGKTPATSSQGRTTGTRSPAAAPTDQRLARLSSQRQGRCSGSCGPSCTCCTMHTQECESLSAHASCRVRQAQRVRCTLGQETRRRACRQQRIGPGWRRCRRLKPLTLKPCINGLKPDPKKSQKKPSNAARRLDPQAVEPSSPWGRARRRACRRPRTGPGWPRSPRRRSRARAA